MEKSASITEIAKALAKFAFTIGKIPKDSENPFFKSKYAALSDILDKIQPVLTDCDLIISQHPDGDNALTTILIHTISGEYLQSTYSVHPTKQDPQAIGSAITYARRYSIGAALCLNIDTDDDGNAASVPNTQTTATAKNTQADDGKPWLNDKAAAQIVARIASGEAGLIEKTKAAFKISKVNMELLKNASNA